MLSDKEKDIIIKESIDLCRKIISNTYISTHKFNSTKKTMIIGTEEISEKAQQILNRL